MAENTTPTAAATRTHSSDRVIGGLTSMLDGRYSTMSAALSRTHHGTDVDDCSGDIRDDGS